MAKTEVVTLRVSEDVKKELKKAFGENATISDMVRGCIDNYLNKIEEIESGIAIVKVPMEHVSIEEADELYTIFRDLEDKVSSRIIKHSKPEDLEGLRGLEGLRLLQETKNSLIKARYAKEIKEKRDMKRKEIDKSFNGINMAQTTDEQPEVKEVK